MDITSELIIGAVGGLIATGIVGIIVLIFNKIVWPKINELTYRGIDISGDWVCKEFIETKRNDQTKKVKRREYYLSLNQSGHKLNGEITIKNIHPSTGIEDFSYFKILGIIKNNFVQIDVEAKSKKSIGLGTFLFKLRGGGDSLQGSVVATEKDTLDIMTINNLLFKRK